MKQNTISLPVGLGMLLLAGSLLGPSSLPAGGADVIGIVDLTRVLRSYPRGKQLLQEMRGRVEAQQGKLNEGLRQVEKLKIELDGYTRLTPQWIETNAKLQEMKVGLDSRFKAQEERLTREKARIEWGCLRAVEEAIAELAKKRGIRLVLRARSVPEELGLQERWMWNNWRDVLYAGDELDLTDAVINLLKSSNPPDAGTAAPGDGK